MKKKVTVIGTGMDGCDTITKKGSKAIENSQLLIGADRILKPFEKLGKPCFHSYDAKKISEYISNCEYENIAVLMSGDCGFYSGALSLLPYLENYDTEVISGISSPSYFCSKLGMGYGDMRFVSLHGKNENIIRHIASNRKTFFLLGGSISPKDICLRLCEYEMGDLTVHIGENLAIENEVIKSGKAKDFQYADFGRLCVMIVENHNFERFLKSCIDDDEFVRGNVPMTKCEVRSVCVSKLMIGRNDVCWDIGCGTGSVSVEAAMRCPSGKVYAVEKNSDAVILTEKNRHKFRCDNIEIILGEASSAVENLPAPDCVFIGGSGGKLENIVKTAVTKNPRARIVVTSVSLETLEICLKTFGQYGLLCNVTQIAVTRTNTVGNHTMLKAENPIFIIERSFKNE